MLLLTMISQANLQSIYDLQEKFKRLIITNPSIRSESFEQNNFFESILNALQELINYITLIVALKKYIKDEDINEDFDNIITTLTELYDNYQEQKHSNLFEMKTFSRNHVNRIIHLADNIEKVYKLLLKRAQSDLINELE